MDATSAGKRRGRVVEPFSFDKQEGKALLDRVTDLFRPYLQQAHVRQVEAVSWVSFLKADYQTLWWLCAACKDPESSPSSQASQPDFKAPPPCSFVALSYQTGFQLWAVRRDGVSHELLSVDGAASRQLCILPAPCHAGRDSCVADRPLLAVVQCMAEVCPGGYTCLSLYSPLSGKVVKTVQFSAEILHVAANSRVVAVSTRRQVLLLNAASFEQCLVKVSSQDIAFNALALGDQWLAFTDHEINVEYASLGGVGDDQQPTYTAAVLNAAKSGASALGHGISAIGTALGRMATMSAARTSSGPDGVATDPGIGIVTVVDTATVRRLTADGHKDKGKQCVSISSQDDAVCCIVAHFKAHSNESIGVLEFDPSGSLLVACGSAGRRFNVYRIENQSPADSCATLVHHLYTLCRGETSAMVQCASFSHDSRWLTVTTDHGTSHVFAVQPFGGSPAIASHGLAMPSSVSPFQASSGTADQRPDRSGPPSGPVTKLMAGGQSTAAERGHEQLSDVELLATGHPRHGALLATSVRPSLRACTQLEAVGQLKPWNDIPSSASDFTVTSDSALPSEADTTLTSAASGGSMASTVFVQQGDSGDSSPCVLVFSLARGALVQYSISVALDGDADPSILSTTANPKTAWTLFRQTGDLAIGQCIGCVSMENFVKESSLLDRTAAVGSQQALAWYGGSAELQKSDEVSLCYFRPVSSCLPYRLLLAGPQFEIVRDGSSSDEEDPMDAEWTKANSVPGAGDVLLNGPWYDVMSDVQFETEQQSSSQVADCLRSASVSQ